MQKKKKNGNILYRHISKNIREYIIVVLLFLIGIVVGVIVINNSSDFQKNEIYTYVTNLIDSLKKIGNTIDKAVLLKKAISNNLLTAVLIWFMGLTVIGMPIVYGIIALKGFTLGYTLSAIIAILGQNGVAFSIMALSVHNIIYIPAILVIAVSGIRMHKSIMKDKRKENIKLEICRHSISSFIMCLALVLAAFLEVYVSTALLKNYIGVI